MFVPDDWSGSSATAADHTTETPKPPRAIVEVERRWRLRPHRSISAAPVIATRWHALENGYCEVTAETPLHCYVIAIALRRMEVRLMLAGETVLDGIAVPGALFVAAPGVAARCSFRGPADELHLHVAEDLVAKCAREICGPAAARLALEPVPAPDPVIERLARALIAAERMSDGLGRRYVESIGTAIVARLMSRVPQTARRHAPKIAALARWRLKRAMDYVETSLHEPVSLAELASAAGLTRMHFAAQFRAATGLRPHEYLLRRRIERAQELLLRQDLSLVDVALSVGFQTQSHFTNVFKRFAGQAPGAWRLSHAIAAASCAFETGRAGWKDKAAGTPNEPRGTDAGEHQVHRVARWG